MSSPRNSLHYNKNRASGSPRTRKAYYLHPPPSRLIINPSSSASASSIAATPRSNFTTISQALKEKGENLQKYQKFFNAEEVDENTFLSLKFEEILEIFKRQNLAGKIEEDVLEKDARQISKIIRDLNQF